MHNMQRKYGWQRSLPSPFHKHYTELFQALDALPSSVDLRPNMPPVYDQQTVGSCTGNASAAAFEYDLKKQSLTDFTPSRLFIYYNERKLEGTVLSDAGATITDAMNVLANVGVCSEEVWSYDVTKFAITPTQEAYNQASMHKGVNYYRVDQNENAIKQCLANGYPVVYGFTVFESFESDAVASTGKQPLPSPNEQCLGGHAVLICGYNDDGKYFIVRNSWGSDWGDNGYFYQPYDYTCNSNLADDFWCLQSVSG